MNNELNSKFLKSNKFKFVECCQLNYCQNGEAFINDIRVLLKGNSALKYETGIYNQKIKVKFQKYMEKRTIVVLQYKNI